MAKRHLKNGGKCRSEALVIAMRSITNYVVAVSQKEVCRQLAAEIVYFYAIYAMLYYIYVDHLYFFSKIMFTGQYIITIPSRTAITELLRNGLSVSWIQFCTTDSFASLFPSGGAVALHKLTALAQGALAVVSDAPKIDNRDALAVAKEAASPGLHLAGGGVGDYEETVVDHCAARGQGGLGEEGHRHSARRKHKERTHVHRG